jgi:hypothetical protein
MLMPPRDGQRITPLVVEVPLPLPAEVELGVDVDSDVLDAVLEAEDQAVLVSADEWGKDIEAVEGLDLTYDNYLAVRGLRAAVGAAAPIDDSLYFKYAQQRRGDVLREDAENITKWVTKRAVPSEVVPETVALPAESSPLGQAEGGMVYPTSFNPFHYYNPYADQRAWWVKTRV